MCCIGSLHVLYEHVPAAATAAAAGACIRLWLIIKTSSPVCCIGSLHVLYVHVPAAATAAAAAAAGKFIWLRLIKKISGPVCCMYCTCLLLLLACAFSCALLDDKGLPSGMLHRSVWSLMLAWSSSRRLFQKGGVKMYTCMHRLPPKGGVITCMCMHRLPPKGGCDNVYVYA